ncbi:MAG TPA: hypothetical protein VJO99_27840 [Burkholderiaceae bacterium]|nr:hypothetical protein [Burkholderiaceae bacterium]
MNKRLILTTIPAVLALCLMTACNKPGSSSAPGGGPAPSNQSASSPMGSGSAP